ncbi:TetR/AcrR family transcriptional regulator [Metabacillus fastidiosus]|uniref:TetR/AcrR family transcriptional regulator n=1 Tax=Metabacillus fastidiosus TaxID=1458 RepID=A0ABU6NXW7_9BACI|nr:TetR/AcrR family transcriptional regulator [Metabacillus fastidiosus]
MRIKEAAIHEFASRGFYSTKVSDIVSRSKLTQPAFYIYFSNKDAIFDELVNDFRLKLNELIGSLRLSSEVKKEDLTLTLTKSIEILFDFFAENENLTRIGLILAHDAEQYKEKIIELLAVNLKYEQKAGYFRSNLSMDIIAVCIYGMIENLIISHLLTKKSTSKMLANEVVSLIMKGL